MEPLVAFEALADQPGPDDLAVVLHEGAVGFVAEGQLSDAGHRQRVQQAAQDGEHQHGSQRGQQLGTHVSSPPGR